MSLHIDYDYLFALRIQLQDDFENESDIIIELNHELLNQGVHKDEIINTLSIFYELYGISISKDTITQVLNEATNSNILQHNNSLNQFINIINSQLIGGLQPFIIPLNQNVQLNQDAQPSAHVEENTESKNEDQYIESKEENENQEEENKNQEEENENHEENNIQEGENENHEEENENHEEENENHEEENKNQEEDFEDMPPLIQHIEPTIQIIEGPGMVQIGFALNAQIHQIANSINSGLGGNIMQQFIAGLGPGLNGAIGGLNSSASGLYSSGGGQSLESVLNSLAPPVVSTLNEEDFQKIKKYKAVSKLQENCSICMCSMDENEELCELICNHHFHNECIEPWLKKYNYKCPVCRTELGKTSNN